jgi:hypothetical protein
MLILDGKTVDFAIISRKDTRRAGRRFIMRGLDREGNVANCVETEHIVTSYEKDGSMRVASYS